MATRRWSLVVLVAAAMLLALVGAAAAATFIRWNGGLGYGYGNGIGIPVRVGQPFSIGMTVLKPDREVRIEGVQLHGPKAESGSSAWASYRRAEAALGPIDTFRPGTRR